MISFLKKGVEKWNSEKDKFNLFDFRNLDLSGMTLNGYDFGGIDLSRVNLSNANISYSNFYLSNLSSSYFYNTKAKGCVFTDSNLDNSEIVHSNLIGSSLVGASLRDTNFFGSDLCICNLSGSQLRNTNFSAIKINDTSFTNIDLTNAILDNIEYQGPCDIGLMTLEQTASSLINFGNQYAIECFFRGCGIADGWIEHFRSLIGSPIQWYSAFISYSHIDSSFAKRLYDQLQGRGIRCWLDEHSMKPGERILDSVNQAIRATDRMLICCSEHSLESWWVKDEIRKALEKEMNEKRDIIVPLNLDGYLFEGWKDGLATDIKSRLAADFTGWSNDNSKFETQFERVVLSLKSSLK